MVSNRKNILPKIIQGGMGVKISDWLLAKTVSSLGQRGTLSGVALERIASIILQLGDPGGHLMKALAHFPFPGLAEKVISAFRFNKGLASQQVFRGTPAFSLKPSELLISLTICANFAFVWLAKEGHNNPVGINYLEKLAMPHVYAIAGAMLADVDYITMGAGIPWQIPAVIENLSQGEAVSYRIPVVGTSIKDYTISFDLKKILKTENLSLKKPGFIPIIASNLLAQILMTKTKPGSVQGFVIENPSAGGHNAPPRRIVFDNDGALVYGPKDQVDFQRIADYGLPFWIGGSMSSPQKLDWALSHGATGIQAGSIFALSQESGMEQSLKQRIRALGFNEKLTVKTDPMISPTGYPFKVVQLDDSISDPLVYQCRTRTCDQKALVSLYEKTDGTIGYRCSAEPLSDYLAKGGTEAEAQGKACLCNGLMATTGIQTKKNHEAPLVTLGGDLDFLKDLMTTPEDSYTAEQAVNYLLGEI